METEDFLDISDVLPIAAARAHREAYLFVKLGAFPVKDKAHIEARIFNTYVRLCPLKSSTGHRMTPEGDMFFWNLFYDGEAILKMFQ